MQAIPAMPNAEILPEQIAALRFKEAVRTAQQSIASRELRMRNWLSKHPTVGNFIEPSANSRTPIANWTDRLILFTAGVFTIGVRPVAQDANGRLQKASWRSHLVHMVLPKDRYAQIEPLLLNKPIRGALQLSAMAVFRYQRDKLLQMPLLIARLMDSWDHRKEWKSEKINTKEWFAKHVTKIDAPFQTTTELVATCLKIVPQAAAVSSADGTAQNLLRTKQYDLWAVQLAKQITAVAAEIPAAKQRIFEKTLADLREARWKAEAAVRAETVTTATPDAATAAAVAAAAHAASVAGEAADVAAAEAAVSHIKADFQTCLTAALERCEWANKIPSSLSLTKEIDGNFSLRIEYKDKAVFTRGPTMDEIHLFGRNSLIQKNEVTRLQSLGARLEAKLADKPVFQRVAGADIFLPITGLPAAANPGQQYATTTRPFAQQLTGFKAFAVFCRKHLAGPPLSVTARIIDRACTLSLDVSNMSNFLFKAKKSDLTDPLLTGGYRNLKRHVENTYGRQIEQRLQQQYPGLSSDLLKANKLLCVARAISTALDDKVTFGAVPLNALINGALLQMSVVRQARPLEEMFQQPAVIIPPRPAPVVAAATETEASSAESESENVVDIASARERKDAESPKPSSSSGPHMF